MGLILKIHILKERDLPKNGTKKADPLAGFSYHKQDQPIKQKLVNKNLAIHIANHAFL